MATETHFLKTKILNKKSRTNKQEQSKKKLQHSTGLVWWFTFASRSFSFLVYGFAEINGVVLCICGAEMTNST